MSKDLRNTLIPKGRTIYFDEEKHKYSNELGIVYTSVTTIISKYTSEFDKEEIAKRCEAIGRNPAHPKYLKYKGKTASQLIREWATTTEDACAHGSKTHNYLETAVKANNLYNINAKGFIEGKIYTIDDIITKHNFGKINLSTFKKHGIDSRYPAIYNTLSDLTKLGYYIYAEIGVYEDLYFVSGLIDILCVNHKTKEFIIIDWKTNKAPIKFESGYYEKKLDGTLDLTKWISKDEYFKHPISHLADSVGYHYAMQLSTYAYLVSTFGFKLRGIVLYHIRPLEEANKPRELWKEVVEPYTIEYLGNESRYMLDDFKSKQTPQTNLLFQL